MFRLKTISNGERLNSIVFKAISDGNKLKNKHFITISDGKIINNIYFKTKADGRRIISMLTQLFLKHAKAELTGAIGLRIVCLLLKVIA